MRKGNLLMLFFCLALAACAHNNRAGGNNAESDSLVEVAVEEEYSDVDASDEISTDETSPAEKTESKASKEASVRKFLSDMYATVLPAAVKGDGEKYVPKYFGEDLLDWYRMVNKYDETYHAGDIGCFDCDLWTQSQDPDDDLKATVESVRFDTDYMDNEYAVARVKLKGKYYPPVFFNVRLAYDGSRWVIIDYNGIASRMKFYMAEQS